MEERIKKAADEARKFNKTSDPADQARCAEACFRQLAYAFAEATTDDERKTLRVALTFADTQLGY